MEGLLQLDSYTKLEDLLLAAAGSRGGDRQLMAYNVMSIYETLDADMSAPHDKTTLEFRQHELTVDGERVIQWVKLLCKVIIFLENGQPQSPVDLLRVTANETWVKTGIKNDDIETEERLGPILAEGRFMIADLLEHMRLHDSTDYYRFRFIKQPSTHGFRGHNPTVFQAAGPLEAYCGAVENVKFDKTSICYTSKPQM